MAIIQQAVSHWCAGKSLQTASDYERLKGIGITGVEMPPAEQYELIRSAGLTIPSIGAHPLIPQGLNNPQYHSQIADQIRASLEVARQNDIPNLICFSGDRDGIGEDEGAANTAEGLRLVAKDAEAAGVTLILELLNSKRDHKGYQCDHTSWGVQVVSAVGSPRVKLLYDIYHMQIMEGDLITTIRDNISHIGHFHTAGNPGRHDLDDQQEIHYPGVVRAIVDTGYAGWIGHEFLPRGDAFAAWEQAVKLCPTGSAA